MPSEGPDTKIRVVLVADLFCGAALKFLGGPALLAQAKRLRLAVGRTLVAESEERHATAGLIVTDVLREAEAWLIDERLEASASEGVAFAGRLSQPEDFAMTCGVVVPVDRSLIEEVILDTFAWRRGDAEQVAQDPRFAIAIYRTAIDNGTMGGVTYD
jgi:hypothetical protein